MKKYINYGIFFLVINMMIDTHCHLSIEDYDDIDAIVANMAPNIMIISGVNDQTNAEVMKYVGKYSNVYGMVGIHPGNIADLTPSSFEQLATYLKHPKIVGVGEIGLDYHYPGIDKLKQQQLFEQQIMLAKQFNKPIIIHSRDAYLDTYHIIERHYEPSLKIVMHCYSYSLESAQELLKFNVKFGIGGVLTFKNSKKLQAIVETLSIDHFLLETDSPYLTPEPWRGTRNQPKNVIYVAQKMAELKGISVEKVLLMTTKNACTQFDLPIKI